MTLNEEQLRFFYNEVLGLMEWDEEVEASGIDPLQFVRDEVDGLRREVRRKQNMVEKMRARFDAFDSPDDREDSNPLFF